MHSTIALAPDVEAGLAEFQTASGLSFNDAVNAVLRRGLASCASEYRMPVRTLGMRPGLNVDRIRHEIDRLDDARLFDSEA